MMQFSLQRLFSSMRGERTFIPSSPTYFGGIAALPLLHHPGEAWEYSVSTDVLGRVVEVASGGMELDRVIAERITKPLRMRDTEGESAVGRRRAVFDGGGLWAILPDAAECRVLENITDFVAAFSGGPGETNPQAGEEERFAGFRSNGGDGDEFWFGVRGADGSGAESCAGFRG
jgi:CubicO group peptidase (beta-lactamase class C family)